MVKVVHIRCRYSPVIVMFNEFSLRNVGSTYVSNVVVCTTN